MTDHPHSPNGTGTTSGDVLGVPPVWLSVPRRLTFPSEVSSGILSIRPWHPDNTWRFWHAVPALPWFTPFAEARGVVQIPAGYEARLELYPDPTSDPPRIRFAPLAHLQPNDIQALSVRPHLYLRHLFDRLPDPRAITDGSIAAIQALAGLQSLTIDLLTDADLVHLQALRALQALDLGGSRWITGAGFVHLQHLPHLAGLELDFVHALQCAMLAHLQALPHLRGIAFTDAWDAAIPSAALAVPHLEAFWSAFPAMLPPAALPLLQRQHQLQSLSLIDEGGWVSGAMLRSIGSLTNLRTLDLAGFGSFESADLTAVQHLPHLQALSLKGSDLPPAALADLISPMGSLQQLDLEHTSLDDATVAPWRALPHLRSFNAGSTLLGDAGLTAIAACAPLEDVQLWCNHVIQGHALGALARLAQLHTLDLGGMDQLDPNHLQSLAHLPALKVLSLAGLRLTRQQLAFLRDLPALTSLCLSGAKGTGTLLAAIQPCTNLRTLDLTGTAITDTDLSTLASIQQLEELKLGETAISDAGGAALGTMSNLKHLDLRRTQVSATGVARLRQALPACTIIDAAWQVHYPFATRSYPA
jgi:Leucine-rich repeat (LRR) protein